ncbi:MAG: hypothetical protein HRU72_00065 [Planctomycetia bacterium]|nr:MAG: hypothetical protein HRU72_00065 [Planctomycetia bacterium]TVL96881.1 MAG: hypothetical protein CV082_05670 [Candidatus Brocadia sp. BL1]HQU32442.1 C25 family cysteine peptidase [Candidatus Brocadia sapporoensis]
MMKNILIIAGVVFCGMYLPLCRAEASHSNKIRVLRSDSDGAVLELRLSGFQTETTEYEGESYQSITAPDTVQSDQPGKPRMPVCGTLLGVPAVDGVSLQIIDASFKTVPGYRLLPAPEWKVSGNNMDEPDIEKAFIMDQDIYHTSAFYPEAIAGIGYTGYLRDQAVAQVQFYPVQYNPVEGVVRLYRRILVKVTWNARQVAPSPRRAPGTGRAYEETLKSHLLNYDALQRPASSPEISSPDATIESQELLEKSSGGTSLKIGVTEDGIYKLTYNDLDAAGLKLNSIDPRTIIVSNKGVEIPVHLQGEDDGTFDTNDYLLFYGIANKDIYTTKNIYWLTVGTGTGKRMTAVDGTLSGNAAIPEYFPTTLHAEVDSEYWQTMPNGGSEDHWFWDKQLTAPSLQSAQPEGTNTVSKNYFLSLNHISTENATAEVRVRLKGRTSVQSVNPDHHTKIYLNDVKVDDQTWDGQQIYDHKVTVLQSALLEGTNTVRLELPGDTRATVDQVFMNWIEIGYLDTYVAEQDKLLFGAPSNGTFQFEVTGFGKNTVMVFDVTDPVSPSWITHTNVLKSGNTYTLQFEGNAQEGTQYLALASSQFKSPSGIERDQPSSWKSTSNKADYLIITHENFYTSAQKLANYRSGAGWKVAVIKVGDIYDEFNYGIFNPQAIRDFLTYAYNHWAAPAPSYVLLVGDACQDFRDLYKTGTLNYVPSQNIETDILGETPSDNWFVQVSGDDILPDMYLGRLSVQTKPDAANIVDKIISYEKNPPAEPWNKNALFVADDDDISFEEMSEQLAGLLPGSYKANKVYVSTYSSGNPTQDIINYINKGSLLTNYSGHGAVDRWGLWANNKKAILNASGITSLDNTNKLTMVTTANCLNGYFAGTNPQKSVAEQFHLLKGKGAIAVWAPTALSYTSGHRLLFNELYKNFFQYNLHGLGAATTNAKISAYAKSKAWGELVETFVLFGDPLTRLGIPEEVSLSVDTPNGGEIIPAGSTYTIQWTASKDMVKFTLKYSLNKGKTWKNIAKDVTGASYEWQTPGTKKSKNQCLVRVMGYDNSGKKKAKDVSDAPFTIEAAL